MRALFDGFDYLTSELGSILNLCEWIDRQNDSEISAALPVLHAQMHTHLDTLVEHFNTWRVQVRIDQEAGRGNQKA